MPAVLALPWLGTAITGVAGGTAAVVGAKMASNASTKGAQLTTDAARESARLQTEAANHAADVQKQSSDAALAHQKEQDALAAARAETDRRANFDQYQSRARGAQNLGSALGFNIDLPDYVPGNNPTSGAPGSGSAGASTLQALLAKGLDPQAAVAQFNKENGRTTGNEAVYYDPSQHGGKATIGLPDAYLSQEANGWQITNRGGGGGSAPASKNTISAFLAPQANQTPFIDPNQAVLKIPPPAAYQPKRNTIGAYFGGRA